MKYNIFKYLLVAAVSVGFIACDDEIEVDVLNTNTIAVSGQWDITITKAGVVDDHVTIHSYNTASNVVDSIYLWDGASAGDHGVRIKVKCDVDALTFSAENTLNILSDADLFTVTEGKIMLGKATTKGGNVTDSIRYVLNDGTDEYVYAGHRYTGFAEDN